MLAISPKRTFTVGLCSFGDVQTQGTLIGEFHVQPIKHDIEEVCIKCVLSQSQS